NHEGGAASATVAAGTTPGNAAGVAAAGVAAAGAPTAAESAVLLPRAGFWIRLLASLLDLALVCMVVSGLVPGLSHHQKPFLFVWVAFHLGFWAWCGTTIGGMVCRLKIVRLDGRPMNAATALVRLLASFFSAAALGLG